jgi:hypothetical protein
MIQNRRAQVWITDVTISIVLFTAAVLIAFNIIMNSFATQNDYERQKSDASRISEYVLSEGTPTDWNSTNMIRPGMMTGKRLNATKVRYAMNLSNSSYAAIRSSMQTDYDFIVLFENSSGGIIPFQDLCSFGKPNEGINFTYVNSTPSCIFNISRISYDNLVKINRYVVYDSSIIRMETYLWN